MLIDTIQLFVGLLLLWGGAELLIRSGSSIALRLGIPVIAVGLIFLGFGTSAPELLVSLKAAYMGHDDIAIGNVIGSNIVNSSLIIGLAALIKPIAIKSTLLKQDLPIMVAVSAILSLLMLLLPEIGRGIGVCFITGLIGYIYFSIILGKEDKTINEIELLEIKQYQMKSFYYEILFLLVGFSILFLGGSLFLNGALSIAKIFTISDAVIGLTIVAVGTSLPELAVSIIAITKKQDDVSIGNIVGSNIFNILAIIGLASLIDPIAFPGITIEQPLFMTVLAGAVWVMARNGSVISRKEGALLVISYVCFIIYNISLVIS